MVSLIPRLSSFAVSGTPARSQISDMIHVLRYLFSPVHRMHTYTPTHYRFLRVTDVTDPWRVWARLLKPGYVREFAQLFNRFSIRYDHHEESYKLLLTTLTTRTVKSAIKDELIIPKQTRYLVPVELGKIERHVRFKEAFSTYLRYPSYASL